MPQRIVTLEEHFAPAEMNYRAGQDRQQRDYVTERIKDLEEVRLPEMDACGIDMQVLSMAHPGTQHEPDPKKAVALAIACNDSMAHTIAPHLDRFRSFAALPCQDPPAAADELERSVHELGFVGALINGHTLGAYLDEERFYPIWERACALDVPIYLHPTHSPEPIAALRGYPELQVAAWGWAVETGSHALRLVCSGLFDRFPGARVILGHMGEFLPFNQWRLDDRYLNNMNRRQLQKRPSEYIRENFYVTTSGVPSIEPLVCTIAALGVDRVMFSIDYPMQYAKEAVDFIRSAQIDPDDLEMICHSNAEKLLGV